MTSSLLRMPKMPPMLLLERLLMPQPLLRMHKNRLLEVQLRQSLMPPLLSKSKMPPPLMLLKLPTKLKLLPMPKLEESRQKQLLMLVLLSKPKKTPKLLK